MPNLSYNAQMAPVWKQGDHTTCEK